MPEETAKQNGSEVDDLKKKRKEDIVNNFATPLIGTFLNLPNHSVMIKCPACGIMEMSQTEDDLRYWKLNNVCGCLHVLFCCCFCFDECVPFKQTDRNHYCKNCGCYFGRAMKHAPLPPKSRKSGIKL